jgi:osmotically-inducible protein OsmY
MSPKIGEKPKSYEDIVRKTVVDPDSSARPTVGQERAAREGYRALDPEETELQERLLRVLASAGPSMAGVTVEVVRNLVTLRGRVATAAALHTLEDIVARVPGVDTVHDQVVIG